MAIGTTGNPKIDSLLWGYSWTGTAKAAATVTYNTNLLTWGHDGLQNTTDWDYSATNVAQIGTVSILVSAMQVWSNVANITFASTTSINPKLVIRTSTSITNNDTGSDSSGVVFPVGRSGTQFLKLDMLLKSDQLTGATEGTDQYHTLIHELGHVVGLKDVDLYAQGYNYNTSIMSYTSSPSGAIPHTPMIYDIAAAQYLYGANEDHKKGDDTHAATGEKKLWTIWDAGGVHDRLDIASALGASKGAVIDLRGGVNAANDNILHKKLVMIKNYA